MAVGTCWERGLERQVGADWKVPVKVPVSQDKEFKFYPVNRGEPTEVCRDKEVAGSGLKRL